MRCIWSLGLCQDAELKTFFVTVAGEMLNLKENFFFAFVALEKCFDQVPRDVLLWVLRKPGMVE